METILFPPPLLLSKTLVEAALAERSVVIPVGSKNPTTLPDRWIRNSSNGGPRSSLATWDCQISTRYYDVDEEVAEPNSGLIHSILMDAAGVGITLDGIGPADFAWVVRTRFVSGPTRLTDPDLPDLELYQSVVLWTLHYVP